MTNDLPLDSALPWFHWWAWSERTPLPCLRVSLRQAGLSLALAAAATADRKYERSSRTLIGMWDFVGADSRR